MEIDSTTEYLNNCARKAFLKIQEEQSSSEGKKSRESRRDLWQLENAIHIGELNDSRAKNEYYLKRYG